MTKYETGGVELTRESGGPNSGADDPAEATPSLAPGDRVRMSAWGRARHPRYGDRQGLIVGQGSPSSWRVKFDGRRRIQAIHRDYLEKVERSGIGTLGQSGIE
ncbi:hypothetical protein [Bradyrhizobium canariense]|uniref:Uncharacterized protein n=1 Tax=Bradyrhizobium canariense TaxID=255045 RepID=A0A1H2AFX5_9BRAD|nr:hypothetical protein [Bradyrhizobium canariense]SDT44729.1 hypothetical protein SAMN05444158_6124 [Bradyrhizobium canariense]